MSTDIGRHWILADGQLSSVSDANFDLASGGSGPSIASYDLREYWDTKVADRLAELERRLDANAVVWATRGWLALRRVRLRTRSRVSTEWVAVLGRPNATPEELSQALGHALQSGALDSAEMLLERLRPQIAEMSRESWARARHLEIETLLVLGDRREAARVASQHQPALQETTRGVALLELLGVHQGTWLPSGGPNVLGLERSLGSGEAAALELARRLSQRPWSWIQNEELRLLLGNVLLPSEPAVARRFLDSFLRVYGLSGLDFEPTRSAAGVLSAARPRARAVQQAGPLVSILVPAHQCAGTLGYALQSLLHQTHQNLEVLVADDASDDDTLAVMQRYRQDPRVRLFRSERNQGAYNVRNGLAARARGTWLGFHDADDFALPERIEWQLKALRGTRSIACVASLLRVASDGRVVFYKDQRATRLSRASLVLKRAVFEGLGGFRRARFGADEEFYAKLVLRFGDECVHRIHAPLMLCASWQGSATRKAGAESLEDGYRSPARRRYSEHVFRKYLVGEDISDAVIDRTLNERGNYAEPAELIEL